MTQSDLKGELASLRIDRGRRGRSRWRWPILFLVPVVVGLAALYVLRARAAFRAVEVETVQAAVAGPEAVAAGEPILTASGYVVARRKAVVSAKIQGRLATLRVEEGSRVERGEVLARLESQDYEAQVQRAAALVSRAQADLAEYERQLRQARRLEGDAVLARDEREAAESRVRLAEAALRQAEAERAFAEATLQNTLIRAPFRGVVVKKMAEVGESVAPIPPGVNISTSSGAIVALADLDTLEVEADVAEANVARLGPQQPAEVTVEAFPDRRFQAVLRQVIPTADRTKATVQVKVTIVDKDQDLKPEMSAKVTFLRPEAEAAPAAAASVVTVPRAAVVTRDGKPGVFELVEGKARLRPVVLGPERKDAVVVRDGLRGGEVLVARPTDAVRDGDALRVRR
jgi:RND family efflux transporter MFP subunit